MISLKYDNLLKDINVNNKTIGSIVYQIISLSERIEGLTIHLKTFKKDLHSKRGLIAVVNKRKKLLNYIKSSNNKDYNSLLVLLNIRK